MSDARAGSEPTPPPSEARVWAVVVTFNRVELLRQSLAALAAQERPADHVLVVDNASTDDTREVLSAEFGWVEVLALPENRGGAGGFHAGMQTAHAAGADWVWLMDDDTIPAPTALAELLHAPARLGGASAPLLLASRAVWKDGELHPMNEPAFKLDLAQLVPGCEQGLLPLRNATFVSLLVHRAAIDGFGLPHAKFFIWSDDIEYTARILRAGPFGWFVPDSVVEHRTKTAHTAVADTGGRFYFHVRNTLWMLRGDAWSRREKLSVAWGLLSTLRAYARGPSAAREKMLIVLRGLRDGVLDSPARPASRT